MNLFDLSGKTALVTGGNGGIGYGIAKGLAEAGADIVIAARDESKTDQSVKSIKAFGVNATGLDVDVANESSVKKMVAESIDFTGHIDILINNAGIGIRKLPHEYPLEDWNRVIDVNLTGSFICARELHSHMKKNGGGKIVNILSLIHI